MSDLTPDGIVRSASMMGLCSQTHHEHLMRDAATVRKATLAPAPSDPAAPLTYRDALHLTDKLGAAYARIAWLESALDAPPSDPAAPLECPHCDVRHQWPCPTIPRCDQRGCEDEATCGWPSPSGLAYRRTCGKHATRLGTPHRLTAPPRPQGGRMMNRVCEIEGCLYPCGPTCPHSHTPSDPAATLREAAQAAMDVMNDVMEAGEDVTDRLGLVVNLRLVHAADALRAALATPTPEEDNDYMDRVNHGEFAAPEEAERE